MHARGRCRPTTHRSWSTSTGRGSPGPQWLGAGISSGCGDARPSSGDMRPAVVLVAIIAAAAAAGTAVSLTQRPQAKPHSPSPSPSVALALPSNQPAVAFGFSVAADLAFHSLVLFGGVDDFDTTWLWNGAAWVRVHPATSPPGRYGASEAFDPQIGEVLLFGGTLQTG